MSTSIRTLFASRSGAFIAVADQAVVAGSGFICLMLLGRYLPAVHFGAYVVALGLLNVLLALHGAFINTPLSLRAGGDFESDHLLSYIRGAGRLQFLQVGSVAATALVTAIALEEANPWRSILLVFAVLQVPYQLNDFTRRLMLARHAFRELLWNDLVVALLRIGALTALLAGGGRSLLPASIVLASGYLVGVVLYACGNGRRYWARPVLVETCSAFDVGRLHWPLTRSMIPEVLAYQLSLQGVLMFSASLIAPVEVAVLGGTQAIANVVNVFLMGMSNYGFADMVRSRHRGDFAAWKSGARALATATTLGTLACALGFVLVPKFFIELAFDRTSYMMEYAFALRIFGFIVVARTGAVVLVMMLRSLAQQSIITRASIIAGGVSLILAPVLMNRFGLVGALVTILLVQFVLVLSLAVPVVSAWSRLRAEFVSEEPSVQGFQ